MTIKKCAPEQSAVEELSTDEVMLGGQLMTRSQALGRILAMRELSDRARIEELKLSAELASLSYVSDKG